MLKPTLCCTRTASTLNTDPRMRGTPQSDCYTAPSNLLLPLNRQVQGICARKGRSQRATRQFPGCPRTCTSRLWGNAKACKHTVLLRTASTRPALPCCEHGPSALLASGRLSYPSVRSSYGQAHTRVFPLIIGLCAPIVKNWDTTKVKRRYTEDADLN